MKEGNTWKPEELPPNKTPLTTRWLFKKKFDPLNNKQIYKARLVVRGCQQKQNVDYDESYAPVPKMSTFRTMLSIAMNNGWQIFQLDIQTAFVNRSIDRNIYIEILQGVKVNKKDKRKVLKLERALYGLKQTPLQWYKCLTDKLKILKFKQCKLDFCLFKNMHGDTHTYLLVYVDDIIITGNSSKEIKHVTEHLKNTFNVHDLGLLKNFVGMSWLWH